MYARSHGYSPAGSRGILFSKPSKELELLTTCFSDSPQKPLSQDCVSNDIHVDVVDEHGEESLFFGGEILVKLFFDVSLIVRLERW